MLKKKKKNMLNCADIDEWNSLWSISETASFFNSHQWYKACSQSMFHNICIWFVYQDSMLIAVVSLEPTKRWFISCFVSFGQPYTGKSTILVHDNYVSMIPNIIKQLDIRKMIMLTEVEESQCKNFLVGTIHEIASVSPYLLLNQDVYRQVKKQEWNYISKKADKSGFKLSVYNGEESLAHIDVLWNIEQRSHKLQKGRQLFKSDRVKKLYALLSKAPETMLAVLYDDEIAIACFFGFYVKNSFLVDYISFDEEYKKDSPGKLVIVLLYKYLISIGCEKFDYSRGESMWKRHYSSYSENNYTLYFTKNKPVSFWISACLRIKQFYYLGRRKIKHFLFRKHK
jgi:hypothetical protein